MESPSCLNHRNVFRLVLNNYLLTFYVSVLPRLSNLKKLRMLVSPNTPSIAKHVCQTKTFYLLKIKFHTCPLSTLHTTRDYLTPLHLPSSMQRQQVATKKNQNRTKTNGRRERASSLMSRYPRYKPQPQPANTHKREGQFPSPGSPALSDPHRLHHEHSSAAGTTKLWHPAARADRQHPHQEAAPSDWGALTFATPPSSPKLSPGGRVSPSQPRLPAATYQGVFSVGGLCLQSCGDIDQGGISPERAEIGVLLGRGTDPTSAPL